MNLRFDTTFTILPQHCNYHFPMVFGGAFFSEMDLCAAACVSRLLHDSVCDSAVTHKFEGTFHKPTYCGDLIFLESWITELRHKAVVIRVEAFREKQAVGGRDFVAEGKFVFVTKKGDSYHPHGLELPIPKND